MGRSTLDFQSDSLDFEMFGATRLLDFNRVLLHLKLGSWDLTVFDIGILGSQDFPPFRALVISLEIL